MIYDIALLLMLSLLFSFLSFYPQKKDSNAENTVFVLPEELTSK